MIKKVLGYVLIVPGVILGFGSMGVGFSDGLSYFIIMIIMGYSLYILGQWLRIGTEEFKEKYVRFTAAYFQCIIFMSTMAFLFDGYSEIKGETLSRDDFLWFQLASSPSVTDLFIIVFMVFVLAVMPKTLFGWSTGGKQLTFFVIIMFITFTSVLYVLWNDFRGIHETEGIVTSRWTGAKEQITWEEIESVTITPYIKRRVANEYGDELLFAWSFLFVEADGSRTEFENWDLSEYGLHQSQEVRDKIVKENIPLLFVEMDKETRIYYESDLDIYKLDREEFDEFFLQ